MTFILIIYTFLILIETIAISAFIFSIWNFYITRKAPCVFMPESIIPKIIAALNLNNESVFYDLGSGDGRIIFAVHEKMPKVNIVGIDISPWNIYLSNRKKNKINDKENITFIKKDIIKADLSKATHVFSYLFPEFMDRLLPKLEKELKPGTIFISCDFTFANKKPIKVIDLNRKEGVIARYLYVYKF